MNHSKRVLEILSIQCKPISRKIIYNQIKTSHHPFQTMMKTLTELELVSRPKKGYYLITEQGQEILNHVRKSKC